MERKKILTGKMSLDLRKEIIECLVWSVALYAAETWTLSKGLKHLKCGYGEGWKRSVGQQKSVILKFWLVMQDRCIVNTIKQRKRKWLGHVLRHDVLLRDILEGRMLAMSSWHAPERERMLGKRTRGRKRLQLMSNICYEGTSYKSVKKWAEDRCLWRVLGMVLMTCYSIYSSTPEVDQRKQEWIF